MKNPQSNLTNESAQKQLKSFLIAAWIIAIASLFFFGWAAIAAAVFGARCVLLSWHPGNTSTPHASALKVASLTVTILALAETGLTLLAH